MKFYLFNPENSKTPIFADVNYRHLRVRISTGISIETIHWDKNKQRVSHKCFDHTLINNKLRTVELRIMSLINEIKINERDLNLNEFREEIQFIIKPNKYSKIKLNKEDEKQDFLRIFKEWIVMRGYSKMYNESTIVGYDNTYDTIKKYCEMTNYSLRFDNFNKDFYVKFYSYLMNDLKMKEITIGSKLKHLKTFIRELINEGKILNINISFIKIVKEASEDKIALDDEDIQKLRDYKPDTKKKDQVRDLFLFQIFTLQRMSDLFAISKNHLDLNNNLIRIKQIKTGKEVNLPLLDIHLEILKKYNFILPKITESKYNLLIKEVCKEAGLTDEIMIYQKDGKKTILSKFKKYEKVSSHTARRTGITLCIRKKMPFEEVMKLSGHTTMQSLEQYIKISQNEAISTAKQIFNKPQEV